MSALGRMLAWLEGRIGLGRSGDEAAQAAASRKAFAMAAENLGSRAMGKRTGLRARNKNWRPRYARKGLRP